MPAFHLFVAVRAFEAVHVPYLPHDADRTVLQHVLVAVFAPLPVLLHKVLHAVTENVRGGERRDKKKGRDEEKKEMREKKSQY